MADPTLRSGNEKVSAVASTKKTGPSKRKSPKSKAAATNVEEATFVEGVTSSEEVADQPNEVAEIESVDQVDEAVQKSAADISFEAEAGVDEVTSTPVDLDDPTPAMVPDKASENNFLPLVLGGIIAGALGFMAAELDVFSNGDADITTKLRGDLNTQQERLAVLEGAEVDLSPIETQLAEIVDRITALEERPAGAVSDGVDAGAYAAELKAMKSSVEALLSNAKSIEEATADSAKAASAQAALTKVFSALDAGQPFPDAFAALVELDVGEIDPALGAAAADGVASLNSLQSEFPDQARAALASARANSAEEGQQGLGGFLKRSLGARSVTPREGDDPDAILSRAEAAMKTGDLIGTLIELDTLPEEAQAAIADWRTTADARVAARAAADALAQRLTAD